MDRFFQSRLPEPPELDEGQKGTGAVMRFLAEQDGPVSAGRISEAAHVSTARTAVVLKKLEDKGVILRSEDPSDARKSLISLTDKGRDIVDRQKEHALDFIAKVIDDMGEQDFRRLIDLSFALKEAIQRNMKHEPPEAMLHDELGE